ncbi:hypothetical protein LXL04_003225 [Taraxacum kok-saghyz]
MRLGYVIGTVDPFSIAPMFDGNGRSFFYCRRTLNKSTNISASLPYLGILYPFNLNILTVLDESESGRVDLGMFFAILSPICGGSPEKRKRVAFDSLLWWPVNEQQQEGKGKIIRVDALRYIKLLRLIYIPSQGTSELLEIHGETDDSMVSFTEFTDMFDDSDWGFGILPTLMKLEFSDRNRHGKQSCGVCRYPIIGSRFKEMKSGFSLCGQCYSEGKVPTSFKFDEYRFKEYVKESEAVKDKCMWFSLQKSSSGTATNIQGSFKDGGGGRRSSGTGSRRRGTGRRPILDADDFINLVHGSDLVKVELNRLENEVRDKDRELSESQAEIKERLREKAVEERQFLELGKKKVYTEAVCPVFLVVTFAARASHLH